MNYKNIDENVSGDVTITTNVLTARIATWALDFYNRICLGQVEELAHLIRQNLVPVFSADPSVAVTKPSFEQSDRIKEILNDAKRTLGYLPGASMGIGHPHMHISGLRAYELQKVIQKALAYDRDPNPSFKTVDYDGIICKYTEDPDPKAAVVNDSSEVNNHDRDSRPVVVNMNSAQAQVFAKSLDLYTRICLGKLEVIADMLRDEILPQNRPNASGERMPATIEQIDKVEHLLNHVKGMLGYQPNGSMSIGHAHVDVSGRRAHELCKLIDQSLHSFTEGDAEPVSIHSADSTVEIKQAAKLKKGKRTNPN